MADHPLLLPHVPDTPLPVTQLSAPLPPRNDPSSSAASMPADPHDLSESLEPLISAIIARKARQRRYTP